MINGVAGFLREGQRAMEQNRQSVADIDIIEICQNFL
jgi:hypothetical protein